MKQLTGVLIDTEAREARILTIKDELDEFYKILNCETIDIVKRRVGRSEVNIICDDEGTFREDPKISAIGNLGNVMLVGNLFVVGIEDNEGELTSLDNPENILRKCRMTPTRQHPEGLMMLTQCDY